MAQNNAKIPNIEWMIAAGIDPKTGLPVKAMGTGCELKTNIKMLLRILDEQNAVNRYLWYNLPSTLNGQLLERILYYRGQGAFFYMKENNQFYFLPYSLSAPENSSGLDIYGRYTGITPLTFNGTFDTTGKTKDKEFIQGLIKIPQYDQMLEPDINIFDNGCVLLSDYTNQISQINVARQILNDPLLDMMSEAYPFARTALLANSGIKGMRVNSEADQSNVKAASRSITKAALNGDPWVPYVGNIEFQEFTSGGSALKSEEYLMYLQSLDNFRLSLYGLQSSGMFQKKDHMLESEQEMNSGNTKLIYNDGLTIRQRFCDIGILETHAAFMVVCDKPVTNLPVNVIWNSTTRRGILFLFSDFQIVQLHFSAAGISGKPCYIKDAPSLWLEM